MNSLVTIIKKELADHFSSYRFTIIFALIAMVSLITAYMVGLNIRKELEGVAKPQFIFLMLFTSTGTVFSLVSPVVASAPPGRVRILSLTSLCPGVTAGK